MEFKKSKNLKWQVSLFVLLVFLVTMIPLPKITAKAASGGSIVINSDKSVTITAQYDGSELYLIGTLVGGWSETANQVAMTNNGDGTFSYTTAVLSAGTYEYKFKPNASGWKGAFNAEGIDANSTVTIHEPGVTLNGDGTATFRYEYSGASLYLVGSMNTWTEAIPMTKNSYGLFEVTIDVTSGTTYQYKYKVTDNMSDWSTGSFGQDGTDANSVLSVPGEATAYAPINNGDGTVTFTYKNLSATKVYVAGDFGGSYQWKPTGLEMTQDPVDGLWKLTINPSDIDSTKTDGTDIQYKFVVDGTSWVTDPANENYASGNSVFTYYKYEDAMAPNLNADGTVTFSYKDDTATSVAFAGDVNSWSSTSKVFTKNSYGIWTVTVDPLGAKSITYKFVVDGSNWIIDPNAQDTVSDGFGGSNGVFNTSGAVAESKKVIIKYIREDKDYSDWTFYTWNTGKKDGDYTFTERDGVGIAEIPVGDTTASIGFKIRKDLLWNTVDYDSDRTIAVDQDAMVTKVTVTSGVGDIFVVPSVKKTAEINNGQIDFKYRDVDLYNADEQDKIEDMKLKVKYQDGDYKTIDMDYDNLNEYFAASYKNIKEGTYTYKFVYKVEGTEKESAEETINYTKRTMKGSASVKANSINSTENAVLTLKLSGDDAKKEYIKAIYLDLSELGGSSKTAMDVDLLDDSKEIRQTIGVEDSITAGKKNIPITIVDVNGEEHKTSTSIEITAKVYNDNDPLDFSFDESSIYFMVTDRFFNGNTSNDDPNGNNYDKTTPHTYHGGDIAGITEKIPYLKDLGINTIWITPIVEQTDFDQMYANPAMSQYSYHGYWAKDFTKLDEHLGTIQEFKTLIDTAHENGIKIMVDVVLNHAGYGMDNADASAASVNNYPTDDDRTKFAGMFRTADGNDDFTTASSGLPDFKTEDKDVRDKLIEWQTAWLSTLMTENGNTIDYYRVDTVKHVEDATWKEFKSALTEINPEFKMIGEYYGADYNNDGGQLENGQMDALLDFGYKTYARNFVNGSLDTVSNILDERASKISNTYLFGQFLSSHDEDGFLVGIDGNVDNEITDRDRALGLVAASLQITDKGIPVVYYGEEVGLSGSNSFDNGQKNRYDMQFDLATDGSTGEKTYNHYKTLLNVRNANKEVFAKGNRKTVVANNDEKYTVYTRTYKNNSILTALNIADTAKEITVTIPESAGKQVKDLYSGNTYVAAADNTVKITIPAAQDGGTAMFAYTTSDSSIDNTNTNNGSNTNKSSSNQSQSSKSKKTGDNNNSMIYMMLCMVAVGAIVVTLNRKKEVEE